MMITYSEISNSLDDLHFSLAWARSVVNSDTSASVVEFGFGGARDPSTEIGDGFTLPPEISKRVAIATIEISRSLYGEEYPAVAILLLVAKLAMKESANRMLNALENAPNSWEWCAPLKREFRTLMTDSAIDITSVLSFENFEVERDMLPIRESIRNAHNALIPIKNKIVPELWRENDLIRQRTASVAPGVWNDCVRRASDALSALQPRSLLAKAVQSLADLLSTKPSQPIGSADQHLANFVVGTEQLNMNRGPVAAITASYPERRVLDLCCDALNVVQNQVILGEQSITVEEISTLLMSNGLPHLPTEYARIAAEIDVPVTYKGIVSEFYKAWQAAGMIDENKRTSNHAELIEKFLNKLTPAQTQVLEKHVVSSRRNDAVDVPSRLRQISENWVSKPSTRPGFNSPKAMGTQKGTQTTRKKKKPK